MPFGSIHEAVIAVDRGDVDRALVPVENSLEGGVTATLDALAWDAPDTVILGEAVLAIRNCLIAREPIALDAIEAVISHPQPLAQCARFLRAELPAPPCAARLDRRRRAHRRAVARAVGGARPDAARPSATAAACCARRSTTSPATRRASCGSAPAGGDGSAPTATSAWKTSVVFAGAGDAQPGWLVRCLSEFAFRAA